MARQRRVYLTSTEVAAACAVSVKTIHNWAERAMVPCFKTPGRQLRFKPREIAAWLREKGYDVPSAIAKMASGEAAAVGEPSTRSR